MTPYTQGVWQVKPGRADEFVQAWTEFAEWTKTHADGARWAKLLRDSDDENRFVSFGPWESTAAIEQWRSLAGWGERIAKVRDLLAGSTGHARNGRGARRMTDVRGLARLEFGDWKLASSSRTML